ncbi:UbiD family decarboxylase [Delftia tsuruhatensis]|uniref:UbiD family decarboxylase n=1 Tax=Delftia tsuruhatensis TaxID=180282 RepID=UPI0006422717
MEIIMDFLESYRTPEGSWMADDQPLRMYTSPTRGQFPVLMGMFGSRRLCRLFLDPKGSYAADISDAQLLMQAVDSQVAAHVLEKARLPRSVVKQPDLARLLPVLSYGSRDPGPTITLGLVYARDAKAGIGNCSFHRITVKDGSVAIGIYPGGHLQRLIDAHVARGVQLSVSVNIGIDPAIYLASVLGRPSVDFGFDELAAAGALREMAVEIAPCFHNQGWFIDHAEITLEGALGEEMEFESPFPDGLSMPEYLGYQSPWGMVSTLQIQAATFRPDAVYQTLSGPGMEQSTLLGIGQECAVYAKLREWRILDLVRSVVSLPSGGGHLLTVLQVSKKAPQDDAKILDIAEALIGEVSSLMNLLIVDWDVNARSPADVLWALATRSRLDMDIHASAVLPGTPLDPSQSREYARQERDGTTRKCVVDCTVPSGLQARFRRAFVGDL